MLGAADRVRRTMGSVLDAMGLGPQETPHRFSLSAPGLQLRSYGGRGAPLLIVPAPIKRHYIWDLLPPLSVVRKALAAGYSVYLAEWKETASDHGIDHYVSLIERCVDAIQDERGRPPSMLTHSLGGILCVLHAARYPARCKGLALLEVPLHFDARTRGEFEPFLQRGRAADLRMTLGEVPGTWLTLAAVAASPRTFVLERQQDAAAAMSDWQTWRTHQMAMRWSLDEFAMPGALFEDVVDGLYRENRLMEGRFEVHGQPVGPKDLSAPLAVVVDPRSRVIPAESSLAFYRAAGSADKLALQYEGDVGVALQHLGVLIGRNAHAVVWPKLLGWLAAPSSR